MEQNQLKEVLETVKASEITTDIKQAVQETKQEVKRAVDMKVDIVRRYCNGTVNNTVRP